MNPETSAALIGAAVGGGSSLLAQFLTHRLGLRRDRRSLLREQRFTAVEKAALVLGSSSPDGEGREARAGSILGDHPEITGLAEGMHSAIALLQVHFGTDHKVVRSYADAWAVCAQAKVRVAASERIIKRRLAEAGIGESVTQEDVQKIAAKEIGDDAQALLDALKARDSWTQEARRAAMRT